MSMKDNIHISFDLDGTLIDSLDLMEESWKYATSKLDINIRFVDYKKYIGMPFKEIINKLGLEDEYQVIYDYYFEFSRDNIDKIKLNLETESIIQYLDSYDIEWSIITSKPKDRTLEILDYFKIKSKYIICPEDVIKGKPNNDSIVKLKQIAGIKTDVEVYYVGDMLSDLQFAIESDIHYIHYVGGIDSCFSEDIMNNYYKINNLSEIKELLSLNI